MDKAFIEKNQIIERYLAGKLPIKGVQDFERFCRDNPAILDELGFADAVNRGLRLLEAGGHTSVLQEVKPLWWQRATTTYGLLAVLLIAATLALLQLNRASRLAGEIAVLEEQLQIGPLRPSSTTRSVRVVPDRRPSNRIHLTVQPRQPPEQLEIRVDVAFAKLNTFRVTVDKKDQARVGTIYHVLRDSNGQLRVSLNTSSLHRGDYRMKVEGVTRRGELVPVAWFNVRVAG